jgi:WD40 repeat protein
MIEVYCGIVAVSYRQIKEIHLFDVEEGKLLRTIATNGPILHFSKLKDGRMLATGDSLTIWNVDTWECECVLDTAEAAYFTSAFQIVTDGRIVSFSSNPYALYIWTIL